MDKEPRQGRSALQRFFFLLIGICIGVYVAGSFLFYSNIPQNKLKVLLENEMSKAMRREVSIGSVSGNLLTQVRLKRVRIANHAQLSGGAMIEIGEVVADYNPIALVRHRGDIFPAIHTIKLNRVWVALVRDQHERWNLLELITPPPPKPGQKALPPPQFHGKIYVNNLYGYYLDEKGWGEKKQVFREPIHSSVGILNFRDLRKVELSLSGKMDSSDGLFNLSGYFNEYNGQFFIQFDISKLNTQKWGGYLVPVEGFDFADDVVAISGHMKSKHPFPKRGIPFYYSVHIVFQDLNLKMPFFREPLQQLKGRVEIENYRDEFAMTFREFQGFIAQIPIAGKGLLNMDKKYVRFDIDTSSFDIRHFKKLFPDISGWRMNGSGSARVVVDGNSSSPKISGDFSMPKGELFYLKPENLQLQFVYDQQLLTFQTQTAQLHGGPLSGSGSFSTKTRQMQVSFTGHDTQMYPILETPFSRNAVLDFQVQLSGIPSDYILASQLQFRKLTYSNQRIDRFTGNFRFKGKSIQLGDGIVYLNSGSVPLHVTGTLDAMRYARLQFRGSGVPFYDPDPSVSPSVASKGTLTIQSDIAFDTGGRLSVPSYTVWNGSADIRLADMSLFGFSFQSGDLDLGFKPHLLTLKNVRLTGKDHALTASGKVQDQTPVSLAVSLKQVEIGKFVRFQKLLPPFLFPVTGRVSMDVRLDRLSDQAVFNFKNWKSVSGFRASGQFELVEATIQGQPIDRIALALNWNGQKLDLSKAEVAYHNSFVSGSGSATIDGKLDFHIQDGSRLWLSDFYIWAPQLKTVSGTALISSTISGTIQEPTAELRFKLSPLQTRTLTLDSVSGIVTYSSEEIGIQKLAITQLTDQYFISGKAGTAWLLGKSATPSYDVSAQLNTVDASRFSILVEGLYQEFLLRRSKPRGSFFSKRWDAVMPKSLQVSTRNPWAKTGQGFLVYSDQTPRSVLSYYRRLSSRLHSEQTHLENQFKPFISGQISGTFRVRQTPAQKAMVFDSNLTLSSFQASELRAASATVVAGSNDRRAGDLDIRVNFRNGFVGNMPFQALEFAGRLNADRDLHIDQLALNPASQDMVLTGFVPLSAIWTPQHRTRPLDLTMRLGENKLGALLSAIPGMKSMRALSSAATVRVNGTLDYPIVSSTPITIRDAQFAVAAYSEPFRMGLGTVQFNSNTAQFDLPILWGREEKPNRLAFMGQIGLRRLSLLTPSFAVVDTHVNITDTDLNLTSFTYYNGGVSLRGFSLEGPLWIGLTDTAKARLAADKGTSREKGPILKGQIALANGRVPVSEFLKKSETGYIPLLLNLSLAVRDDVFIEGSVLGKTLVSDLTNSLSLEITPTLEDLRVTGSAAVPMIEHSLTFRQGSANFLNRVFELMSQDQQSKYLKDDPLLVGPNTLSFQTTLDTQSNQRRMVPVLNIKALSLIEPLETTPNTTSVDANNTATAVVLLFRGPVTDTNSIRLAEYEVDNYRSAAYSPRLIRIFELNDSQSSNSEVLGTLTRDLSGSRGAVQFGASQVNSLLRSQLRPVEKQIAKGTGLYDVRINYNLGQQIFQANPYQREAQIVGVDLISKLAQNLFLRVRTDLDFSTESRLEYGTVRLSEFELTYYLYRNLTFNYANISNYYDPGTYRTRYSLKYSFEF